ncbi:MAG: EamA family transporter [Candidatus Bipolaricaulota bacterium]
MPISFIKETIIVVLPISFAFIAALLFGLATPISKVLLEGISPFQLAGLLYLGAALVLVPKVIKERGLKKVIRMNSTNKLRVLGAVLFGGIGGPVALLFGLKLASASSVSMWLNLELVFTALLGHYIFKDYLGKLGWIGSFGAVLAAVLLSWQGGIAGIQAGLFVALACLLWGFDNHFTALIDEISPQTNTFLKGLFAGSINLTIGLLIASYGANWQQTTGALVLGAFSYGISIALYIAAAQGIGATRSQIIFASAPFFGVGASVLILGEVLTLVQIVAAVILVLFLVPLLMDSHLHNHYHREQVHEHIHRHDEAHHEHIHRGINVPGWVPHTHEHKHDEATHSHSHLPDIHHRHKHDD